MNPPTSQAVIGENGVDRQPVDATLRAAHELAQRLKRLNVHIPPFHARVAQMLFQCRGSRFSREEVVCMLILRYPFADEHKLRGCLDDLVRWRIVRRIDGNEDSVHYDIDTLPRPRAVGSLGGKRRVRETDRGGITTLPARI